MDPYIAYLHSLMTSAIATQNRSEEIRLRALLLQFKREASK